MNNTIRIAVLAGLCVTAVVMTVGAVRSIAAPEAASPPPAVVSNASVEDKNAEFYLRDCSGYVAVFKGADMRFFLEKLPQEILKKQKSLH